ncbi:MAG: hypothetical protein R3B66_12075 [Candidatus Scalinduaceae bacterium]
MKRMSAKRIGKTKKSTGFKDSSEKRNFKDLKNMEKKLRGCSKRS